MKWSDINRSPSSRTLRQFAALCLVIFGGLAVWQGLVRHHVAAAVAFSVLATTLGPLGLIRPQSLRWVYVGWMMAAFPIGWAVSRIILAAFYFGMLTPLAIAFRLCGRDVLLRRPQKTASSYWLAKSMPPDPRSYFRQS